MFKNQIVSLNADKDQHNSNLLNSINTTNWQEIMNNGFVNPELIPHTGYGKVTITFQKGIVIDIKQEISLRPSDIIKKKYRPPVK